MFSILYMFLFLVLAQNKDKVTIDGVYILVPVIADCYLINSIFKFLS